MHHALAKLSGEERDKLKRCPQPDFTSPMCATLVHESFSDPDWIYERKLDGQRCLLHKNNNSVTLWSRNQITQNEIFPELVDAVADLPGDFILDAEIVAFAGRRTSFKRLQDRMHVSDPDPSLIEETPVYAYLFDLLHLEEHDLCQVPLRSRKKVLREAFDTADPLRHLPHRNAQGEEFLAEACDRGWEGLIAKKADSSYQHSRSKDWLKFKCGHRQEFVVGGFTDPQGERPGFGALLLGYYEDDHFHYAGRVGTGFDDDFLASFRKQLDRIERKTSPFADFDSADGSIHWVRPHHVGEVGFTEWTDGQRLRHPRFLGLRTDKDASSVRKEGGS